jgi:hypothetical protein
MKLYKLTDANGQTHNATQWGPGVTHETSGKGNLCDSGWLHAYEHPLLAVLLNPIHAKFDSPQLWEAEGEGDVKRDGQLKIGVTRLTTVREISLPAVTTEQRVRFAILCARHVYHDPTWLAWADAWLDGSNRSQASASASSCATATASAAAAAADAASAAAWAWASAALWAWASASAALWASASAADLDLAAIALEACALK